MYRILPSSFSLVLPSSFSVVLLSSFSLVLIYSFNLVLPSSFSLVLPSSSSLLLYLVLLFLYFLLISSLTLSHSSLVKHPPLYVSFLSLFVLAPSAGSYNIFVLYYSTVQLFGPCRSHFLSRKSLVSS